MPRKSSLWGILQTGPATPGGRYLRTFWHPVHRAKDLAPGKAVPVKIMGQDFTLYRGEGGAAHLVDARCPHRGTPLHIGWVESDCIRCRYHGWRFDSSGQCVEQPGEDPAFAGKVRLRRYPTQEYLGLIFAYVGDGEAPPLRRFPDFEQPGVLEVDPPEPWPCSFWNRLDNDPAHLSWTHRVSLSRTRRGIPPAGGDHSQYVETDYGIADSRPNGGRNIFYLPNINQIRTRVRVPGYERLPEYRMVWHVPVADTYTVSFDVNIVPGLAGREAEEFRRKRELHEGDGASPYELAEAILAGKKRVEDMDAGLPIYMQFWVEDYVTMVGQGVAPNFDAEHLGRNDVKVILRRRIFAREMQALAAGKPLKQWTSPALYTDPE